MHRRSVLIASAATAALVVVTACGSQPASTHPAPGAAVTASQGGQAPLTSRAGQLAGNPRYGQGVLRLPPLTGTPASPVP